MRNEPLDEHFIQFAGSLKSAIAYLQKEDSAEFLERQRQQVEELWRLEESFRERLASTAEGLTAYSQFIDFIRDHVRNILDARPYFRERQKRFTAEISGAFKARDAQALSKYAINYRFVRFIQGLPSCPIDSELGRLARAIEKVRNDLAVLNMPLAVSRARIFFGRNVRPHLDMMDLVQIAAGGLLCGIDKFVPPYSRMFRGVAIGRCVGDLIEANSATLLHFFPSDKRVYYNVNKVTGRAVETLDFQELATQVNKLLNKAKPTDASQVADLVAASSFVSMSAAAIEDEGVRVEDAIAAPAEGRPDVIVERQQTSSALAAAISTLSTFQRKFLLAHDGDIAMR